MFNYEERSVSCMYAVVGCSNCQALWIVDGGPETTRCPRCGTRHQFDRLKKFVRTGDRVEAREVRAAMIASAQGREETYEELDSIGAMAEAIDSAGVDDEEYLSEHGLDPEAVAEAGNPPDSGSTSRRDRVIDAIDTLETPTEEAVIDHVGEQGLPAERIRTVLDKLAREGTIVEEHSGYRRL